MLSYLLRVKEKGKSITMGNFIINNPEAQMQVVTVRIQRALQGDQQGMFYGSVVRLPGSDTIREYKGEAVISIPCNFEPVRDPNNNMAHVPQIVSIRVGDKGYVDKDVTNQTASLALKQSDYEKLQDLPGQSWLITLPARVNPNARKGHGREGTFWVENLEANFVLTEAEGPIAAATEADLDESLERGRQFSQDNINKAMARRDDRQKLRPARLLTTAERAAQTKALLKQSGKPGFDDETMKQKAERNAGLAASDIPTAPHRQFIAATNDHMHSQTGVAGGSGQDVDQRVAPVTPDMDANRRTDYADTLDRQADQSKPGSNVGLPPSNDIRQPNEPETGGSASDQGEFQGDEQ